MGLGGWFVERFGKRNMMAIYIIIMIMGGAGMGLTGLFWSEPGHTAAFIALYYTYFVFMTVGMFAVGMSICWKRVAATQFTLYMAAFNLGFSVGASLLGPLRAFWDWEAVFVGFTTIICVALVLMGFFGLKRQTRSIELLETMYPNPIRHDERPLEPVAE
jgi:PAT family beta-lactamase induction signal transducer AmpG